MTRIYQGLSPAGLTAELERLRLPQRTLAALIGSNESTIFAFLSGKRGVSADFQIELFDALRFGRNLQRNSAVPVDFSCTEEILELWKAFCAANAEEQVLRSAAEMQLVPPKREPRARAGIRSFASEGARAVSGVTGAFGAGLPGSAPAGRVFAFATLELCWERWT